MRQTRLELYINTDLTKCISCCCTTAVSLGVDRLNKTALDPVYTEAKRTELFGSVPEKATIDLAITLGILVPCSIRNGFVKMPSSLVPLPNRAFFIALTVRNGPFCLQLITGLIRSLERGSMKI